MDVCVGVGASGPFSEIPSLTRLHQQNISENNEEEREVVAPPPCQSFVDERLPNKVEISGTRVHRKSGCHFLFPDL